MPKLTDTQLVLLTTAHQRPDGSLLPPPASLGNQASCIRKAISTLIKRTLAEESDVVDAAAVWREEDGRRFGVVITNPGREIVAAARRSQEASQNAAAAHTSLNDAATSKRAGASTKQALILGMMRAERGASLTDLVAATGWLPHTTRAALTGLRKKGHSIVTCRSENGTHYRIAAEA